MALLIGMFGHGRRVYAAVKFFLYTMIASCSCWRRFVALRQYNPHTLISSQFKVPSRGASTNFIGAAQWLFLDSSSRSPLKSTVPFPHLAT